MYGRIWHGRGHSGHRPHHSMEGQRELTCANLSQRIGRCVRDKTRQGIAVIYVDRSIIKEIRKADHWEKAWGDQNVIDALVQSGADTGDEDDARVIPGSKAKRSGSSGYH